MTKEVQMSIKEKSTYVMIHHSDCPATSPRRLTLSEISCDCGLPKIARAIKLR